VWSPAGLTAQRGVACRRCGRVQGLPRWRCTRGRGGKKPRVGASGGQKVVVVNGRGAHSIRGASSRSSRTEETPGGAAGRGRRPRCVVHAHRVLQAKNLVGRLQKERGSQRGFGGLRKSSREWANLTFLGSFCFEFLSSFSPCRFTMHTIQAPTQDFQHGIFGCLQDIGTCCCGCLCTPCLHGKPNICFCNRAHRVCSGLWWTNACP
jgi:hypothetical protein